MRTVMLILAIVSLMIVPLASLASAETVLQEDSDRLFLRHDPDADNGCTGAMYLDSQPGSGEPGCGYIGGAPLDELFITAGQGAFGTNSYPASADELPVILDADRDLTGTMVIGADGVGAGIVGYDLTIRVSEPDALGSDVLGTVEVRADANAYVLEDAVLPFTMDIPDEFDEVTIDGLTLEYTPRGLYANHGYHQKNGESFIDVPTLVEVEVG